MRCQFFVCFCFALLLLFFAHRVPYVVSVFITYAIFAPYLICLTMMYAQFYFAWLRIKKFPARIKVNQLKNC